MCTAEGSPQELFERIVTISDAKHVAPRTSSRSRKSDDFDLCVDNELGFAKDRTISRYDAPVASVPFFFFSFQFLLCGLVEIIRDPFKLMQSWGLCFSSSLVLQLPFLACQHMYLN